MDRLIHWIWLGSEMPDRYSRYIAEWKALNPEWDTVVWREAEIEGVKWRNQLVLDHLRQRDDGRRSIEWAVQTADVLSYECVFGFGGVYLNVDVEPVRPLRDLYDMYVNPLLGQEWVAREDRDFVVGMAMGGRAGHPFYKEVIDQLPIRYWRNPGDEMNQTTGPRLLTDVWRRWEDTVAALPVVAFNPWHWSTVPTGGTAEGRAIPDGAIGVHHWGHKLDGRTNRIEGATQRS